MEGYVAVTDIGWYEHLARKPFWDEVNFWRPSARQAFRGVPGTPFLFKLKAPHNAIAGFGLVARYAKLPDWLAWECFGEANGAATLSEMEQRLHEIRARNKIVHDGPVPQIGCILLSGVVVFPRELWIPQPADWPRRNLTSKRYDLSSGEGLRVWRQCERSLMALRTQVREYPVSDSLEPSGLDEIATGFGKDQLVQPRLGQGTFRIAVTDAYGRACAVTGEHSLPALEAAHIRPYKRLGPHEIANGLLLRADLHRLFDKGYLTVTSERRLEISPRLRIDYENGRSYYPYQGRQISLPADPAIRPAQEYLSWHNENVYQA